MLRDILSFQKDQVAGTRVQLIVSFPMGEASVVRMPVFLKTGVGLGREKDSVVVHHAWNCGKSRMVHSYSLSSAPVRYDVGPLL